MKKTNSISMKIKFLFALTFSFILLGCAPESSTAMPTHSLGNDNAPIVVEEFSDLQCPACAAVTPQVEQIIKDNPNLARLEYRHFPLSYHEHAFRAAEASECAADQGKFWAFIDEAFKNQKNLVDSTLVSIAGNIGLDTNTFESCLDSGEKRSKVLSDMALGRRRGVSATPSLYVNGELVRFSGAETFENYLRSLQP